MCLNSVKDLQINPARCRPLKHDKWNVKRRKKTVSDFYFFSFLDITLGSKNKQQTTGINGHGSFCYRNHWSRIGNWSCDDLDKYASALEIAKDRGVWKRKEKRKGKAFAQQWDPKQAI